MSNDAEAREVNATVAGSEETREPANGDQAEPNDRPDITDEDDRVINPDAVIIAEDPGEPDYLDDLDEAEDDMHPDTVVAEAIVVEPVPADDTTAGPVPADDTTAGPVPADDTTAGPVAASFPGGPRHAAADSAPVRSGMPVNGDVPTGSPMAGDPEQLHKRWAAIQSTFVDDPRGSVTSAADLVTEVIAAVVASAKERESGLRGEWDREGVDTEGLRNALRSYRALLDQLAAL
jgi:hypothetical protein